MKNLSTFKSDVLHSLLAGENAILEKLRQQLTQLKIATYVYHDHKGFFIKFDDESITESLGESVSFVLGDVLAELEGMEYPARFHLIVMSGKLKFLKGFSLDEEWKCNYSNYKLYYDTPDRQRNLLLVQTVIDISGKALDPETFKRVSELRSKNWPRK